MRKKHERSKWLERFSVKAKGKIEMIVIFIYTKLIYLGFLSPLRFYFWFRKRSHKLVWEVRKHASPLFLPFFPGFTKLIGHLHFEKCYFIGLPLWTLGRLTYSHPFIQQRRERQGEFWDFHILVGSLEGWNGNMQSNWPRNENSVPDLTMKSIDMQCHAKPI